jgi:CheY-like chemotaxis protein
LVESEQFDLIFMDQYMASTSTATLLGTETVRALRASGVSSTICGLSANNLEEQFVDVGADGFMLKPIPLEKVALEMELARILNVGESRRDHP